MQALILAAGKGTRMKSERPKVLHEVFGLPLLSYVLRTLGELGISRPKVVVGYGADQVRARLGNQAVWVLQSRQWGTGHAAACARRSFAGYKGDILIWPGDMPLLKKETLERFFREHRASGSEVSVLSSLQPDPAGYGRILRSGGGFYAIREELDATGAERRIQEVNTGVYLFRAPLLFEALSKIKPLNRKKEYYLTDTIEILAQAGRRLYAFPLAAGEEGQGINSRRDLSRVTEIMKNREIQYHESRGVTFAAPEQTFVAPGVRIGRDTVIYPWSYIEPGVRIGKKCSIGPFAKIRKGSVIGDGVTVGSFVEINRSKLGKDVSAKHLAYLGDAVVGEKTNIGAGTITANFDGKNKNITRIGRKVLVGSNTVFVAPVTVGDGARTGAGAVVTGGTRVRRGETMVGVPARPVNGNKKRQEKG